MRFSTTVSWEEQSEAFQYNVFMGVNVVFQGGLLNRRWRMSRLLLAFQCNMALLWRLPYQLIMSSSPGGCVWPAVKSHSESFFYIFPLVNDAGHKLATQENLLGFLSPSCVTYNPKTLQCICYCEINTQLCFPKPCTQGKCFLPYRNGVPTPCCPKHLTDGL